MSSARKQARVRFGRCARNPLRRSCVSSERNAGESAIWPVPAQPSAEIVRIECAKCSSIPAQPSAEIMRVECTKCRRECDLSGPLATLCGDRACRVREIPCTCCVPASALFCVHSSSLFLMRFPAAVHAASPLTSSSNTHDDELGPAR